MTIQEIADLLDEKLKPVFERLDKIESRLDTLESDMKEVKDNVRKILLFTPVGNEDVILKLAKH